MVYLAGAGAETGAFEIGASKGPTLFGAGILCLESLSSFGSPYPAERDGFL